MTQDRTWAGLREALAEYRAAEASKAELYRKEKLPHWESCNAYERKEKASDNLAAAAQAVLDARDAEAAQREQATRSLSESIYAGPINLREWLTVEADSLRTAVVDHAQADEIEARYSTPEDPPAVPHDWMGTWGIRAEDDGYEWTASYRGATRIGFARSMTKAVVAAKVALEIMWSNWMFKHDTTAPEPNYPRTPSDSSFTP